MLERGAIMTVPMWPAYDAVGGSIFVLAAILLGVNRALDRAGWARSERRAALATLGAVLGSWFAVATTLAWRGVYQALPSALPSIQFGILAPLAIGAFALRRSSALWRVLDAVPQGWIVGVQVFRVLGVTFLILLAAGQLPGLFAWPAGVGDMTVGVLAALLALAWLRAERDRADGGDRKAPVGRTLLWNILGITDLVVAVSTAFATSPSRLQPSLVDHPNTLISVFPLVLIPTFLVPIAFLLHTVSLLKLRGARSGAGDAGRGATSLARAPGAA
jgi:hypothetical protein